MTQETITHVVDAHYSLIHQAVSRIRKKYPDSDKELLYQEGVLGLLECLHRYDEDSPVVFSVYAYPRIYGRLLDYLRKLDTNARFLRKLLQEYANTKQWFITLYNRPPTTEELLTILQIDFPTYYKIINEQQFHTPESLPTISMTEEELPVEITDGYWQTPITDPETLTILKEQYTIISNTLQTLSPREHTTIYEHYYNDRKFKDINKELNQSHVTTWKIKNKVLDILKHRLEALNN